MQSHSKEERDALSDDDVITFKREMTVGTPKELALAIRAGVESLGPGKLRCLLCGTLTHNRELFVPRNPIAYGGQPGEFRMAVFPLCGPCNVVEEKTDSRKVRDELMRIANKEETIH